MKRRTLYVVPEHPREVREEFRREASRHSISFLYEVGDYFIAPENSPNLEWATDISWNTYEVEIPSVTLGAKNLKESALKTGLSSPRWVRLDGLHHRRAALVAENLPRAECIPFSYLRKNSTKEKTKHPFAGFFLTTPEKAIAIFDSLTPYPGGVIPFLEEKNGPPSRAYLKLWEILARLEHAGIRIPSAGESAVDLGSCPGGWTWALAERGVAVESVDGAPLDPSVEERPEVKFIRGDAFRLPPKKVDWVFSDMICEPRRLPELITRWEGAGCTRFILSLKFKGEADVEAMEKLRTFSGSGIRHLTQNKHELTWFKIPELSRI